MVVAKLLLVLASATVAGEQPQLLCFGAKWCEPCQEMQPTLDRLAREGYPIRKVDVDQYGELANRYQVKAVPTCVLVDGQGRKVDQILQATNYVTLKRLFSHYQIQPAPTTIRGQSPGQIFGGQLQGDQSPGQTFGGQLQGDQSPGQTFGGQLQGDQSPGIEAPVSPNEMVADPKAIRARSLSSTVRLRVEDAEGHSFGTGTIVDVHGQEGLVLTCGHIFRSSEGRGRILIERFDSQTAEPTTGTLISYDIDRDVALVSMKLTRPIELAKLAPLQYQARKGEPVYSVGCNQGDSPTIMEGNINQIDKYLGPPNITASGRPVVGRSGGGLFNAAGELIGVCSAADPDIEEGLYAALPRVYYELDRNGLSFVYQNKQQPPLAEVASVGTTPNLLGPTKIQPPKPLPVGQLPSSQTASNFTSTTTAAATSNSATVPVGKSRELVCILKSEDGSDGQAYVIEDPSDVLLEYLQREARAVKH